MLTCTTGSLDALPGPAGAASGRIAAAWADRPGASAARAAPNTGVDAGSKVPFAGRDGAIVSGRFAAMRVWRGRTGGAGTSGGAGNATERSTTGDGASIAVIAGGCTALRGVPAAARAGVGAVSGSIAAGAMRDAFAVADACGERIGATVGAAGAADTVS